MKKVLITFYFLLFYYFSFSQSKINHIINGSVKANLLTVTEMNMVNILAINVKDSSISFLGITDSLGNFKINIQSEGRYSIIAVSINYYGKLQEPVTILGNKSTNIGVIEVSLKSSVLQEITIIGKKPVLERKIDRLIFNPQNSVLSKNLTANDLLNRLPYTSINTNGEITIRGISGVQLYINDKRFNLSGEQLLNYLQALSVNNISNIEIITTPPAKYDAEGTGGIININLKKDNSLGTFYTARVTFDQSRLPKLNIVGDINIRSKFSLFYFSINTKLGKYYRNEKLNNYYNTSSTIINWNQELNRNRKTITNSYKIAYDVYVNKKITLGISGNGIFLTDDLLLNSISKISKYLMPVDSTLLTDNFVYSKNQTHNLNLYSKILTGKKNNEFNYDFDYTFFDETQDTKTGTNYLSNQTPTVNSFQLFKSYTPRTINIFSSKIDYTLPMKNNSSLSIGLKYSYIHTSNEVVFLTYNSNSNNYILDTTRENKFIYKEKNTAIYTNYSKKFKSGIESQIGLRGELINYNGLQKAGSFGNKYFKIFPSIFLLKTAKNISYQFSYSYRIKRPTFYDINPFRFYINPYIYAEGNPLLQPSFGHNFEFSTTFKKKLSITLYSVLTEQPFMQIPVQDDIKQTFVYNRYNLKQENIFGISLFYNSQVKPFWDISSTASLYKQALKGNIFNNVLKKNILSYQLQLTNSLVISKKKNLSCDIFFNFTSPTFRGLYDVAEIYNIDISFTKSILQNKVFLNLNFFDITNGKISKTNINFGNLNSSFIQNFDTRTLRFSANYKFGKTSIKGKKERKGSNVEELNRL